MSRIVLKEPDAEFPVDLPPLPTNHHPSYITPNGHARLFAQLAELEQRLAQVQTDQIESQLQRTQLSLEIRRLQSRLESAIPVGASVQIPGQIGFGSIVEVCCVDGSEDRYQIVGEDEIDPRNGRISWLSPLGQALMGARTGDCVLWDRPAGEVELEILSVDPG